MSGSIPSARHGLTRVIAPFVAVVLAQALIACLSLYTLSAVRAYVGGESFWSKGQKEAVYFLTLYAETGQESYYQRYSEAIAVPLADRNARLAMEASPVDDATARKGFLGGGNHEADLGGIIWLFVNFRDISYLDRAVQQWRAADPYLLNLAELGSTIHNGITEGEVTHDRKAEWKRQIFAINEEMTPLARAFSEALGEGSRAIQKILMALNAATAALLILLGVWRMRKLLVERTGFEQALTAERERAQITLASIGDAVISTDTRGIVDYLNPAAEALLGMPIVAARGNHLKTLGRIIDTVTGEDDIKRVASLLTGMDDGEFRLTGRTLLRRDGGKVPVSVMGAPLLLGKTVAGGVLVLRDMTSEQEFVAKLSWQASHDMLTGLANRREFERRLQAAIDRIGTASERHALMYLDLDQFKLVNDTCGHAAGDQLLKQISTTLARGLRDGDVLARLGGDEFGILMQDCTPEAAAEIAENLRSAVHKLHFHWNGRPFNTSVSIGLVQLAHEGLSIEDASGAADVACYMAKEKGRNRVQVYLPDDSELKRRFGEMAWVQRIHDALEENRFCLYAQPIMPLGEDEGAHVEILIRLREKNGDMVPPGSFIPAAERYGLMATLDRWVVKTAFATLAARPKSAEIATCAINLSGATFSDDSFCDFVLEQFRKHGVQPSTICFEITETSAIADLESATRFIGALKAEGCRFALDDFGAGMSSFGYLKHLPVDYLKIDGSFVRTMLEDPSDRAMVEMIETIGKVMGKRTIAEFVENDAIVDALRQVGVDYAQGYAIAAPAPFTRTSPVFGRRHDELRQRGAA